MGERQITCLSAIEIPVRAIFDHQISFNLYLKSELLIDRYLSMHEAKKRRAVNFQKYFQIVD